MQACDAIRAVLATHPLNAERVAAGRAPATALLLRGPGERLREQSFFDRHGCVAAMQARAYVRRSSSPVVVICTSRLRACVVSPTKIIAGLALCLGMRLLPAPGASGDYRSNLAAKAEAMAAAMAPDQPHDVRICFYFCFYFFLSISDMIGVHCSLQFGLVHFKAADDAAHDRNVPYRVAYLQAADALLRQLLARLWAHQAACQGGTRYVVCVTGDHSTPVLYGDHSNEPVPLAVAHLADVVAAMGGGDVAAATPLGPIRTPEFSPPGQGGDDGVDAARAAREAPSPAAAVAGDAVWRFDEVSAAAGGLGRFCGASLMPLLRAFSETRAETDATQRT